MSQHVLVTGGAGYIGSVLTPMLMEAGHRVTVIDRLFFGRQTLPADGPNLKVIRDDIRTMDGSRLKGVDAVIDLAAISNDPAGELIQDKTWQINHAGRARVCKLAKEAGVKRYILPSSCSVYGFQEGMLDEKSSTNPLTTYAEANLKAEEDVLPLADDKYCVTVIRQATVYGDSPRMRFDLAINGMTKGFLAKGKIPILRDGTQWRPMVHVRDTSRCMCMLLKAPQDKINGQRFNVGSEEQNYQIKPLAELVAKGLNMPFEMEWYGDPDHRSYQVSFKKIRDTLDFAPQFDAASGARIIADKIKSGELNPNDPKTITVGWYKSLIEMNAFLRDVTRDGEVL